jgi:hypothetical protein
MKNAKRTIKLNKLSKLDKASKISAFTVVVGVTLLMGSTLIIGFSATYKLLHPKPSLEVPNLIDNIEPEQTEPSGLGRLTTTLAVVLLLSGVSATIAFTLMGLNGKKQKLKSKKQRSQPKPIDDPLDYDRDEWSLTSVRPESINRLKKVVKRVHDLELQEIPIMELPQINKNSPLVDRIDLRREYPLSVLLVDDNKALSPRKHI